MNLKFLREALDRSDALAHAQCQTIQALQQTVGAYKATNDILHREIGRLEEIVEVSKETRHAGPR